MFNIYSGSNKIKIANKLSIKIIITFTTTFVLCISSMPSISNENNTYKGVVSAYKNSQRVNWQWWDKFNDPFLTTLLKTSIKNNFDVLIASYKAEAEKNRIEATKRGWFPSIKVGTDYANSGPSELDFYGRERANTRGNEHLVLAPIKVNYELDIWRKNKDKISYSELKQEYLELEKNYIILKTISDVSSIYFNVLNNNRLIFLTQDLVNLREQKHDAIQEKYKLNLVSKEEILNAKNLLNESRAKLNNLIEQNKILKNELNYLVFGDKEKSVINYQNLNNIEIFYNSDFELNTSKLANRPDILMAEKQVKLAKLDVNLMRKKMLPAFSVKGDIFLVTRMFRDFFDKESAMYRIGGGALYDFFNRKENKAELKAKKIEYKKALKEYENAIAVSLVDVKNGLLQLESSIKNHKINQENLKLNQEIFEIQQQKFDLSLINMEEYLVSREKLITAKIVEFNSKTKCLIHSISLYKAMGGNT